MYYIMNMIILNLRKKKNNKFDNKIVGLTWYKNCVKNNWWIIMSMIWICKWNNNWFDKIMKVKKKK